MKATKLTRAAAAKIAKDLVEGGIDDSAIARITAESHGVSIAQVWAIRRVLNRPAMVKPGTPGFSRHELRQQRNESLCSMVDAIANGWEDEALNLRQ